MARTRGVTRLMSFVGITSCLLFLLLGAGAPQAQKTPRPSLPHVGKNGNLATNDQIETDRQPAFQVTNSIHGSSASPCRRFSNEFETQARVLSESADTNAVVGVSIDLERVIGESRALQLTTGARILRSGKDRTPSFPFVSGDGFRAVCHLIYDETTQTVLRSGVEGTNDHAGGFADLTSLYPNASIFVQTHLLDDFIADYLQSGKMPPTARFVLVTHNSDYSAPWERNNPRSKGDLITTYAHHRRFILANPQVVAWYAQNKVIEHP
jgi:hypothetical protein